ncbi:hemerythrin domain-containing protein [Ideonella sp. BN130291]|uniref:hemerythrin domain-containing protein n=1 Tax=Ideonella sp. BN130291 TaxID=3112940 RepID=UPI002E26C0AF|nr:hemerythrin domain-containing protein [Ideonella sp. BN130291]
MNNVLSKMSPSITKMIRMDHTHVLSTFHKFEVDTSSVRKQAIVKTACLALEIHAQLEEEIFYPALQAVAGDNQVLHKAKPEHDEMKRLIAELRGLAPEDEAFDLKFHELMRDVMHHVADEETVLLPAAELLLKDRLGELGAQMTRRRLELAGPRVAEIAGNSALAMPAGTMLMAGGLLAGGYLLKRAFEQRRH